MVERLFCVIAYPVCYLPPSNFILQCPMDAGRGRHVRSDNGIFFWETESDKYKNIGVKNLSPQYFYVGDVRSRDVSEFEQIWTVVRSEDFFRDQR